LEHVEVFVVLGLLVVTGLFGVFLLTVETVACEILIGLATLKESQLAFNVEVGVYLAKSGLSPGYGLP
jgi:hypothetical protein